MRCVMSYKCKFDLGEAQEFSTAIGPLAFCPRMEINKDLQAEGKMYLWYLTWFGFKVTIIAESWKGSLTHIGPLWERSVGRTATSLGISHFSHRCLQLFREDGRNKNITVILGYGKTDFCSETHICSHHWHIPLCYTFQLGSYSHNLY